MQSGPTLLLAPDALAMAVNDYLEFACSMIWQAARLGDRFAIVDVPGGGDPANDAPDRIAAVIERFRKGIEPAGAAKSYGAAYFPYLVTTAAGGRRRMERRSLHARAASLREQRGRRRGPAPGAR